MVLYLLLVEFWECGNIDYVAMTVIGQQCIGKRMEGSGSDLPNKDCPSFWLVEGMERTRSWSYDKRPWDRGPTVALQPYRTEMPSLDCMFGKCVVPPLFDVRLWDSTWSAPRSVVAVRSAALHLYIPLTSHLYTNFCTVPAYTSKQAFNCLHHWHAQGSLTLPL